MGKEKCMSNFNSQSRLTDYFYSKTVLNLNRKVLSATEIRILEKSLYYASIQNKILINFLFFCWLTVYADFRANLPENCENCCEPPRVGDCSEKLEFLPRVFLFVYWLSIYLFYLLFTYSYIYFLFTLKVLFIRSCINSVVEHCVAISTSCVVILVK